MDEDRDLKIGRGEGESEAAPLLAEEQQMFFGFDRQALAKMPIYSLLYHVLTSDAGGLKSKA